MHWHLMMVTTILCAGGVSLSARAAAPDAAEGLLLANDGRSGYHIVLADDASPATKWGAAELQRWLREMTGATLPIVSDTQPTGEREIVLGDNKHLAALGAKIDFASLGTEGYVLRTVGRHLIIAGGEGRGTMYGVYGLLEEHLGCRWFTPQVSRIPKTDRLLVPPLDETKKPSFEYRSNFVRACWDGPWTARNRLNGDSQSGHLTGEYGGGVKYGPGGRGHTSLRLVPPHKHFKEHPEYYVLRKGRRVTGEICWSSEGALKIATEQIRQDMRAHPEATVFSVSQMDGRDWSCECDKCVALATAEGTKMGPVLTFVNRVADAVKDEFPGNAIITFAYNWTRTAPKTIKPRPNVIIFLCNLENCFLHPQATCEYPPNVDYVKQIKRWAAISNRLWVWNYETNFHHYLVPFPNYHTWAPNYRFFHANSVTGLFTQDDYQNVHGELAGFGGYVRAKLLWDVNYDADKATNEFLEGVYGKAAGPIRRYIDMLVEKVTRENIHSRVYGMYPWPYLTEPIMIKADELWTQAEAAVKDQPEALQRVRIARLSPDYAIIEHQRRRAKVDKTRIDHEHFLYATDNAALDERIRRFLDLAPKAGIVTLREGYFALNSNIREISLTPLPPARPGKLAAGLNYGLAEGRWKNVLDFEWMLNAKRGTAAAFDLAAAGKGKGFGVNFRGYLRVPRNGVYTFGVRSAGPCNLYIGGKSGQFWRDNLLVVDNDRKHSQAEATGTRPLMAGMHKIRLSLAQPPGGGDVVVSWEGPGIAKQPIPADALFRDAAGPVKGAAPLPSPAEAKLKAYFRFEDDAARHGQAATEATGAITTAKFNSYVEAQMHWTHAARHGYAVRFGRSGITLGADGEKLLNALDGNFTVCTWVKPHTRNRGEFPILAPAGAVPWSLSLEDGTLALKTSHGVYSVAPAETGIMRGRWHHVAVTFAEITPGEAYEVKFHVNGKLVGGPKKGTFRPTGAGRGWAIGQRRPPKAALTGAAQMDELRIYEGLLTAEEIRAMVPEPNLATGKPVTASAGTHPPQTPEMANDGDVDINGYWGAGPYPQWWQVDLAGTHTINKIHMVNYWLQNRYYQYTIDVSVDGKNYRQIVDRSGNTKPATPEGVVHRFGPTKARYIRVNMLKNSVNIGVHIVEFFVFEPK